MEENDIAAVPVVLYKRLIGAVYLYDIAEATSGPVSPYIKRGITYLRSTNNAEEAWEVMMRNKTTWCPIVDDGEFKGIVTLRSILDAYHEKVTMAKDTASVFE